MVFPFPRGIPFPCTSLVKTSVLSAIEMLHDIALYKFNIHIHIHKTRSSSRRSSHRQ